MNSSRHFTDPGTARPMTRVEWAIARYNWYRACGLLDDLPRQTTGVATYQRSPDPPRPKPHLKWYPLSKPDDDIAAMYQQPVVTAQRYRYSQQAANSRPQTFPTRDHAKRALDDDSSKWSCVDWAIARYNWYRACGLLDDFAPPTAETTRYQRSPDSAPPKPYLKWYPLGKSDENAVTAYQRSVIESPPEPQRRYCQRVEHARARAMLARYQAEQGEVAKGTGSSHPFDSSKHPRDEIGRFTEKGDGATTSVGEASTFHAETPNTKQTSDPDNPGQAFFSVPPEVDLQPTGVGHHYFFQDLLERMAGAQVIDQDAYELAMGFVTGPTEPRHGNSTYNGVTHDQYNKAIEEEWGDFLKERRAKKKTGPVTGAEMRKFIRDSIENANPESTIGKFNTEARALAENWRSKMKSQGHSHWLLSFDPFAVSEADLKKTGKRYLETRAAIASNVAKKARRAGAALAAFGALLLDTAKSKGADASLDGILGTIELLYATGKSDHLRRAVEALSEGKVDEARKILLGSLSDGAYSDGLADKLIDEGVDAKAILAFQSHVEAFFANEHTLQKFQTLVDQLDKNIRQPPKSSWIWRK